MCACSSKQVAEACVANGFRQEEDGVQRRKGPSMEIPERLQEPHKPLSDDQLEELRKIRRLQMMMNMVMSVISQDENLTVEEASELVASTKRAALAMFPDKEFAFDILYKPRLERLMKERFRIQ
jgi:hypothetical protein